MNPEGTKSFRAGIVARSRFIEDLVLERNPAESEELLIATT
jgi:hypothetical protein